MSRSTLRRVAQAVTAVMVGCAGLAFMPGVANAAPTEMIYIVLPHPDDENTMWARATGRSSTTGFNQANTYKVFIYMSRGEESSACNTSTDPSGGGPAWFQGSGSPTGQPNYGEINPWGGGTAWNGKWTAACKNARKRATIGYHNDKAASDTTMPSGLSTFTTHNLPATTVTPTRFDNGTPYTSTSVDVYHSANGMGSVLFFDVGDGNGDVTMQEVDWALGSTRWYRTSTLGLPNLPEREVVGPYFNKLYGSCQSYANLDHEAVHDAVWTYSLLGAGKPRYAATCTADPDKYRTDTVSSTEHSSNISGSTTTRTGLLQQRYGWLIAGYWDSTWTCSTCALTPSQAFWRRTT